MYHALHFEWNAFKINKIIKESLILFSNVRLVFKNQKLIAFQKIVKVKKRDHN